MRSVDRCKEHFQGDRCKKPRHHSSKLIAEPDPVHMGNHSAWRGEGDSKLLLAKNAPRHTPKRNRMVNRIVRSPLTGKVGVMQLSECIKYLEGIQQ